MTELSTRRSILVPIDIHGINRDALETLVRIARQLDRSLLGLMLEDIRLQRVADLPFATEITLAGCHERNLMRAHLSQRHFARGVEAQRQASLPFMAAVLASAALMATGNKLLPVAEATARPLLNPAWVIHPALILTAAEAS